MSYVDYLLDGVMLCLMAVLASLAAVVLVSAAIKYPLGVVGVAGFVCLAYAVGYIHNEGFHVPAAIRRWL